MKEWLNAANYLGCHLRKTTKSINKESIYTNTKIIYNFDWEKGLPQLMVCNKKGYAKKCIIFHYKLLVGEKLDSAPFFTTFSIVIERELLLV